MSICTFPSSCPKKKKKKKKKKEKETNAKDAATLTPAALAESPLPFR
jgi:hypothetical protein